MKTSDQRAGEPATVTAALDASVGRSAASTRERVSAARILLDGQDRAAPGEAPDGLDEATDHHYELYQAQGMVTVALRVIARRLTLDHDAP